MLALVCLRAASFVCAYRGYRGAYGGKLPVGRRSVRRRRRVGEVRVATVDLDPYSRSLALSKAN